MAEILSGDQITEFDAFTAAHSTGSFMQCSMWAEVKYNWEREFVVSRGEDGSIRGAAMVLIRRLPVLGCSLLYSPRGPVCDLNDREVLQDLLEGVKAVAKKYRGYLYKMDPMVLNGDGTFIKTAQQLGFRFTKNAADFTTMQVRKNYMLSLANRDEESLMNSFHSKWRYNIRLARRKGVVCDWYNRQNKVDTKALDDFYRLMQITGRRDNFIIRPKSYFYRMLTAFGDRHCRLYMCYSTEGRPLSGAIAVRYAGKTAYVYGASANEGRSLMPNYLMQWTMMQWTLQEGDTVYDFQGIPHYEDESSPNYGVYRFKKGFNGSVVEFAGEFDYVFSPFYKSAANLGKRALFAYRSLRKLAGGNKHQ